MKKLITPLLLLIFTLALATEAEAQRFTKRKRYASFGVSLNAMNYFGDIVPEPDFTSFRFKSTRPNIGITYTYRVFPRISYRAGLSWGRIVGDDAKSASATEGENRGRYQRNLSFRNDIKEFSFVGMVDLFENRYNYRRRPDFVPYAFAGVALFHHNPKAYYESGSHPGLSAADDIATGWYALQPLGTQGQYANGEGYPDAYKRVQIAIPMGLGVRYKLDRRWDMSFEIGWRKTFTDYLDDASGAYASKADILAGGGDNPKAAALLSDRSAEGPFQSEVQADPSGTPYKRLQGFGTTSDLRRGNKSDDDWYIVSGLTVNYILGTSIRSPKFR